MKRFVQFLGIYLLLFLSSCTFHTGTYNILDYGAKGDGVTDDAAAIQSAINACSEAGGGKVIIPSGYTFMAGPFALASWVDLHIDANAKLIANPDESVYTQSAFGENRGEGMMWIRGEKLQNVSISGQGEINGNGVSFMGRELDDSYELKPVHEFDPRPHVLTLIDCENIRIKDLTMKNSAYWTVHLVGCNDVVVQGIRILNDLKIRNGDGIDLDHTRNVRISDCYIESGDDCICLKNRREYDMYGPCENIVVTNCVMTSRSCAIKIGSENVDKISRVLFDNCIIHDSNRGIGIQNRDEGTVSNVVFSNILIDCKFFSDVWWGKAEPIYVTAYRRAKGDHKDAGWRFPKGASEGEVGPVSNIFFSNIKCESENGIFVGAESPDKVHDVIFDQVDIHLYKRTLFENCVYDIRPCEGEGFIHAKTSAFYLTSVSDIAIRNSSVRWGETDFPTFGKAIEEHDVQRLEKINLSTEKK